MEFGGSRGCRGTLQNHTNGTAGRIEKDKGPVKSYSKQSDARAFRLTKGLLKREFPDVRYGQNQKKIGLNKKRAVIENLKVGGIPGAWRGERTVGAHEKRGKG